jgi:hypothetical protein
MKRILATVAAGLSLAAFSTAMAASPTQDKANTTAGTETSDRTPDKTTATPQSQIDTTKSGETSDRTPAKHGEAQDGSMKSETTTE